MADLVLLDRQDLEEMIKNLQIEKVNFNNNNSLKNSIQIIGIKDVSELTGLKEKTIRWKVSRNQVPCFQRGKPLLFNKNEILNWINNGRKVPIKPDTVTEENINAVKPKFI
jgi:predicted DNA-binding transcriptional regulator AlpA